VKAKDYQTQALDTLDAWLDALVAERSKANRVAAVLAADPTLEIEVPDWTAKAWAVLRTAGRLPPSRNGMSFSSRRDGVGRPVPNACMKVPTAGGKTYIAASAVARIQTKLLGRNTGFVLWVVPNEAIYRQTLNRLSDRTDFLRQVLDRAAAGRVKILTKDSPLDARDAEANLCVMVLMLQSANRETKESLRLFRDRGSVRGFVPPADDIQAHWKLLQAVANLSCYGDQEAANLGSIVKDSLGNALALLRPVVVLDEGHRGFSDLALSTLYGFNPSLVLELSATPKDRPQATPPLFANWLVDIRGAALAAEEMIKLPIDVLAKAGDDWRDCLRESLDQLNRLQAEAEALRASTGRYIRPILLVQVERTGKEARGGAFIHAEDARQFLLAAGLREAEIAVKTADVNDLKSPENQDLLSPRNAIRVIITKQALQEGWDCPFAYVLCCLAANRNLGALTQLVGRILRMPGAQRTGVAALDECYVLTHRAQTGEVLDAIKRGLEDEGMGDLALNVRERASDAPGTRRLPRRPPFRDLEIYLPLVLWAGEGGPRPLDYDADVLARVDFQQVEMAPLIARIPLDGSHALQTQRVRVSLDGAGSAQSTAPDAVLALARFDPLYATRVIGDLVPNAFSARRLIGALLTGLAARGASEALIGSLSSFLLEELRRHLAAEVERLAEQRFRSLLAAAVIQFRLRTDGRNWRMPHELETGQPTAAAQLIRPDGSASERSLFAPAYQADFNTEEAEFACYLDANAAIAWWHRNVARPGQYVIQGWRRNRIYPDFLFALIEQGGRRDLVALETKGDQLAGNLDTNYKRAVMDAVTDAYRHQQVQNAGELEIVVDDKTHMRCKLVLMSEWRTAVPTMMSPADQAACS
jgi:type III restriction enzyme